MSDSHRALAASAAAALTLAASAVFGHHSVAANFDRTTTIELKGTIVAVHIRNPHSQYILKVADNAGNAVEWLIEWSDRNALIRRKVDVERIKVGDAVAITVWPSRRLDNVGFFVEAMLPDGSKFKDCGFREFREAVASSTEYACAEAQGR